MRSGSRSANVEFALANWYDGIARCRAGTSIVSNPPYVAMGDPHLTEGDLRFEPSGALVAGVRRARGAAHDRRRRDSAARGWRRRLIVEHGFDQSAAVQRLLRGAGFAAITVRRDLAGIARVAARKARVKQWRDSQRVRFQQAGTRHRHLQLLRPRRERRHDARMQRDAVALAARDSASCRSRRATARAAAGTRRRVVARVDEPIHLPREMRRVPPNAAGSSTCTNTVAPQPSVGSARPKPASAAGDRFDQQRERVALVARVEAAQRQQRALGLVEQHGGIVASALPCASWIHGCGSFSPALCRRPVRPLVV